METVKQRIEGVVATLRRRRIKTQKGASPLVREFVEGIRRDYHGNPNSLRIALSKCRLAILKAFPGHPAADMLLSEGRASACGIKPEYRCGLSYAEVSRNRLVVQHRVAAQLTELRPIGNPELLINTARRLIAEPGTFAKGPYAGRVRHSSLIAGLCLLTGRRPVEIGFCGSLSPSGKGSPWLEFSGQAKTRDADISEESYPVPALAPTKEILRAFALLRENYTFESAVEFNTRVAHPCAEIVAREITPRWPAIQKPYDLRAVYALLSARKFCPKNMDKDAWFARVLGHKRLIAPDGSVMPGAIAAETATAAFYKRYYIA